MMLFNAGILLATTQAYLMPEENTEHLVYADTRILDPRYARSAEPLVCARERIVDIPSVSITWFTELFIKKTEISAAYLDFIENHLTPE